MYMQIKTKRFKPELQNKVLPQVSSKMYEA